MKWCTVSNAVFVNPDHKGMMMVVGLEGAGKLYTVVMIREIPRKLIY